MKKSFNLRDLKGFNCVSFFFSVSSNKALSITVTGNRESGDKEYFNLNYQYSGSEIHLHQNNMITQSEPVTLDFESPGESKCQAQMNTDAIMTDHGKVLLHYSFTFDFEDETSTAAVFNLTAWKSLH